MKYFSLTENELQKPLLDVGTGDGAFIEYVRNKLGNKQAFGVEKDASRIPQNREGIIVADGLQLPFDDQSFEIVTALSYLLMFIEDRDEIQKALTELLRVTRIGGKVMADVETPESYFILGKQIRCYRAMLMTWIHNKLLWHSSLRILNCAKFLVK